MDEQTTTTAALLREHRRDLRRGLPRYVLARALDRLRPEGVSPLRTALRHAWFTLVFALTFAAGLLVLPHVRVLLAEHPPAAAVDTAAVRADERLHDQVQVLTQAGRCEPVSPSRPPAVVPASAVVYAGGQLTVVPAGRVELGSVVAWCPGGAR